MSSVYKDSGVDVQAGDELVRWLQKTAPEKSPHQDRIYGGIGGFASLFRADFPEMKEPCLVSSTDGVGTKLKLAVHFRKFDTIAQDLVAMCVNDLICCGATPLFFLDYYATGKLNMAEAQSFLSGLRSACHKAQVALTGGETAEMPGVYRDGDFDCAGFSVGVVDRKNVLGAEKVKKGDVLYGVASSGFHSNGYSLLRKIFAPDLQHYKQELMEPTSLYVDLSLKIKDYVHAMAHITGGGVNNILRVIPSELSVELEPWTWPRIYKEVLSRSKTSKADLLNTLNCGMGFVVILPKEQVERFKETATELEHRHFFIGTVKENTKNNHAHILNWEDFSQG